MYNDVQRASAWTLEKSDRTAVKNNPVLRFGPDPRFPSWAWDQIGTGPVRSARTHYWSFAHLRCSNWRSIVRASYPRTFWATTCRENLAEVQHDESTSRRERTTHKTNTNCQNFRAGLGPQECGPERDKVGPHFSSVHFCTKLAGSDWCSIGSGFFLVAFVRSEQCTRKVLSAAA